MDALKSALHLESCSHETLLAGLERGSRVELGFTFKPEALERALNAISGVQASAISELGAREPVQALLYQLLLRGHVSAALVWLWLTGRAPLFFHPLLMRHVLGLLHSRASTPAPANANSSADEDADNDENSPQAQADDASASASSLSSAEQQRLLGALKMFAEQFEFPVAHGEAQGHVLEALLEALAGPRAARARTAAAAHPLEGPVAGVLAALLCKHIGSAAADEAEAEAGRGRLMKALLPALSRGSPVAQRVASQLAAQAAGAGWASAVVLCQHAVVRAPPRAALAVRQALHSAVLAVLAALHEGVRAPQLERMTRFADALAHNASDALRVHAVELAATLLAAPQLSTHLPPAAASGLVRALLGRANDKAPAVRTRALTALAGLPAPLLAPAEVAEPLRAAVLRRAKDERPLVRRAAATLLARACAGEGAARDAALQLSVDAAPGVRREALHAADALFEAGDATGAAHWIATVFPRTADADNAIAQLAAELVNARLFAPLAAPAAAPALHTALWDAVEEGLLETAEVPRYLQRVAARLADNGALPRAVVRALAGRLPDSLLAWTALGAAGARVAPLLDAGQVSGLALAGLQPVPASPADEADDEGAADRAVLSMGAQLRVLEALAGRVDSARGKALEQRVQSLLRDWALPPPLVPAAVRLMVRLTAPNTAWAADLAGRAEALLSEVVLKSGALPASMGRAVLTVGELLATLPSLLASGQLAGLLQGLVGAQLSGGAVLPDAVRALAWSALGRLCVRDERLAKRLAPTLALQVVAYTDAPAAARNNAAVVLADLCVAHPALLNAHFAGVPARDAPELLAHASAADPHPVVRRQALVLLMRLLQLELVRLRPALLAAVVRAGADDAAPVREMALQALELLHAAPKHAPALLNHFGALLYVFNRLVPPADGAAPPGLAIATPELRLAAYERVLERLADEQRLQLVLRLHDDVLAAVTAASHAPVALRPDSPLVADVLRVLASPAIRVGRSARTNPADADEEEAAAPAAAADAVLSANKKLLSRIEKKTLAETIIPNVAALKRELEKAHSPLLRELTTYLREVLREYKAEADALFAADRRLERELRYDLERSAPAPAQQSQAAEASVRSSPRARAALTPAFPISPTNTDAANSSAGHSSPLTRGTPNLSALGPSSPRAAAAGRRRSLLLSPAGGGAAQAVTAPRLRTPAKTAAAKEKEQADENSAPAPAKATAAAPAPAKEKEKAVDEIILSPAKLRAPSRQWRVSLSAQTGADEATAAESPVAPPPKSRPARAARKKAS